MPIGFTPFVFAFRSHVKGFDMNPYGVFFDGVEGLGMSWMER